MGEAALRVVAKDRRPPSDQFTASDADDLGWRFNECEADCGVRSTFDSQIQMLLRKSLSDEARVAETVRKRRLSARLRAEQKPAPASKPARKTFFGEVGSALLEHLGIEPVIEPGGLTEREAQDLGDRADDLRSAQRDGMAWEFMHVNETDSVAPPDPYESNAAAWAVKRSKPIDARLGCISFASHQALKDAYGPAAGDAETNKGLRKKFGSELIEIVVRLVAKTMKIDRATARNVAFWQSKDDSFVTMKKKQAEKLLAAAQADYGQAKVSAWI